VGCSRFTTDKKCPGSDKKNEMTTDPPISDDYGMNASTNTLKRTYIKPITSITTECIHSGLVDVDGKLDGEQKLYRYRVR
jgi:hypothetical protein